MEHVLTAPAGSPVDLAWLIPVVPAVSAAFLLLFGKRLGRLSAAVAILAVGVSAVASTLVFTYLQAQPEEGRVFVREVATWISAGPLDVSWAVLVDPLASVMLLLVTWVGLLIHVYSVGYMHGDPRYHRFFAYLNLFVASMLVLVLGESLLTMFVGWELVGLCSYLLIGFWFERRDYAGAAKKAFVVNRVGDVGFLIAMFVVFGAFGTLSFPAVLAEPAGVLAGGTAVAVGLLLLLAATGKSAQIPLYVWLPDAMAGPTPVSALIHAATMVTAGVYLVARVSPIYALVPGVGLAIAWVGVTTALLAALIACVQNDLKRILAYSTVSQLGYMFVGVGVGDYVAGVFHLLTHGFFKALLFLAAGAVMHALANEVDVWKMGGLWRKMPVTAVTAGIAVLAISGVPPLSGFFSKEEILAAAADTPGGGPIMVIGLVAAGLTAFYMARWFVLIFLGRPRWGADAHPHEAPLSMTLPLVVLAVGSAAGGLIEYPPGEGFLHHWLEPSVVAFTAGPAFVDHGVILVVAVAVAGLGIAAALLTYLRRAPDREPLAVRLGGAYDLALNGFYVDALYSTTVVTPGTLLAGGLSDFDRRGIDGVVNGAARGTAGLAGILRRVQTGYVRSYALAVLAGAVLVLALFAGGRVAGGFF
ncbi:MAG TPA: NADH-quinone oxidoreductase subunit L [Egibacteraceae bacterium]|nr:NADH-quinone oxidoreductase subunit L [Egibacteraceae bacterium]